VSFTVPLLPPSVNHYYRPSRRGGYYISPEAQAFIDAVCIFSGRQACEGKFYAVQISVGIPQAEFLRLDIDNLGKSLLDSLRKAAVIKDDRYVVDLHLTKYVSPDPCTKYLIVGSTELIKAAEPTAKDSAWVCRYCGKKLRDCVCVFDETA